MLLLINSLQLETKHSTRKKNLEHIQAVEPKVSQLSYHKKELKNLELQIAEKEDELGDIGTAERNYTVVKEEHQNALQEQ